MPIRLCLVLCITLMGSPTYAQVIQTLSLSYTQNEIYRRENLVNFTDIGEVMHLSGDYRTRPGMGLSYEVYFPIKEMFLVQIGLEAVSLSSEMQYSTVPLGEGCGSCTIFRETERVGREAVYNNLYVRSPVSFAIPLSLKGTAYMKFGFDLLWRIADFSRWKYAELTWKYEKVQNIWFEQLESEVLKTESLSPKRMETGIFISVLKNFVFENNGLSLEFGGRMGFNRMDDEPAILQRSFFIRFGYIIAH